MNPRVRRVLVPIVVALIGLVIVIIAFRSPRPTPARSPSLDEAARVVGDSATAVQAPASSPPEPVTVPPSAPPAAPVTSLGELRAIAPAGGVSGHEVPPKSLGSLDPRQAKIELQFTRRGAGIKRLALAEHWHTAAARRQAQAHWRAGGTDPSAPLPSDALRYILDAEQSLEGVVIPVLSANAVVINGQTVNLFDYSRDAGGQPVYVWSETSPGVFETQIVDGAGQIVLHIMRRFELGDGTAFTIRQRIENRTQQPLEVRWIQYGPGDLEADRSRYIDRRYFRFGYNLSLAQDPQRLADVNAGKDMMQERTGVLKLDNQQLWPHAKSGSYDLAWFASINRYFALAIHAPFDPAAGARPERSIASVVERIDRRIDPHDASEPIDRVIMTQLHSPLFTMAPGQAASLDLGVYAGPMDRHVLDEQEPYKSLNLGGLILYQLSDICAFCTFQWLAHVLLWFLSLVHDGVRDWGVAIIVLVCLVRLILHPITKKSQINMQRFGRAMQAIKPELDKLQKKHAGDPKKLQTEQIRLMREHGANPLHMLGCLPMFLQTPIWIALYAMLYLAFDLRQEPAFWGVFQLMGGWPFLADLSAADHFFGEFSQPRQFLWWNITGLNLLPILMGVVFYVQQKYMSPPPSPSMTKEQLQQQKIMKWMFVVLFPIMLYSAPSGLTLYIFTSSLIGIIEGRYIRRHVEALDAMRASEPPKPVGVSPPKPKVKDPRARAFAEAIERAKARVKGPGRTFKERK
jgi:YidC/Oxa1 family membrane protein insertase